jgi:hypothetical protein
MTTEPLQHILRPALPWQTERLTECGRNPDDFREGLVIDRVEVKRLLAAHGKQRVAFMVCMTCFGRSNYSHDSWEDNPASVMRRHCERAGFGSDPSLAINVELRALALLVEAHREEFDQAVRDLQGAVPLAARRKQRRAAR